MFKNLLKFLNKQNRNWHAVIKLNKENCSEEAGEKQALEFHRVQSEIEMKYFTTLVPQELFLTNLS